MWLWISDSVFFFSRDLQWVPSGMSWSLVITWDNRTGNTSSSPEQRWQCIKHQDWMIRRVKNILWLFLNLQRNGDVHRSNISESLGASMHSTGLTNQQPKRNPAILWKPLEVVTIKRRCLIFSQMEDILPLADREWNLQATRIKLMLSPFLKSYWEEQQKPCHLWEL